MYSFTTRQTIEQVIKHFATLCVKITEDVGKNLPVTVDHLGCFSDFTMYFIRNNTYPITDAYNQLVYKIKEYWQYEMIADEYKQRSCSYIQLYQMVAMLQQHSKDIEIENIALSAVNEQYENANTITVIKNKPGITFKELQDVLQVDVNVLNKQLHKLEEYHFLVARGNGAYQYYILTKLGTCLYEKLCVLKESTLTEQEITDTQRTLEFLDKYKQEIKA